jgi:2'-5' RNA ligase
MRADPSCFGFQAPRTDGLFFALFPDPPAAAQLEKVAAQQCIRHRLTGRPLAADRFHVSLIGFGAHAGVPRELIAAAMAAGDRVALPAFDVRFDRAVSFLGSPRPRVVCGDNAELVSFQRALGRVVERAGLGGRVKPQWTPHVTLLYDAREIDAHAIEPVRWTVRELVLVHSRRGEGKYVRLARWPLHARLPLAS